MKFTNVFSILGLLIFPAKGLTENLSIAKSSLWQAPYSSVMNVKVTTSEKLGDNCDLYNKLVFSKNGSPIENSAERLDEYRNLPFEYSMENDFIFTFMITPNKISLETENEIPDSEKKLIPFYNQSKSQQNLDTSSLSNFKVKFQPDSFTAVSNSVGLNPLPIKLVYIKGIPALRIQGRDTICDLLNKKIVIEGKGIAHVHLPQKNQPAMYGFYASAQDQINSILSLSEGPMAKAGRISYRLSSLISPTTAYNKETEEATLALFKVLFKENSLELSNIWGRLGDEMTLSPDPAILEPVTVQITN